jgi:hypothetical protein
MKRKLTLLSLRLEILKLNIDQLIDAADVIDFTVMSTFALLLSLKFRRLTRICLPLLRKMCNEYIFALKHLI